jgi:hypothetical protein
MRYTSDMPLESLDEAKNTVQALHRVDRVSSWGIKNTSEDLNEDEALQRFRADPEKYIAPIRGAISEK